MSQSSFIDSLGERITQLFPKQDNKIENSKADGNLLLENLLSRLNLVTREEFEVQKKVLLRTRAKLEMLEKQMEEWEKNNK
jgi:BMFP domain-containing protein YqiC